MKQFNQKLVIAAVVLLSVAQTHIVTAEPTSFLDIVVGQREGVPLRQLLPYLALGGAVGVIGTLLTEDPTILERCKNFAKKSAQSSIAFLKENRAILAGSASVGCLLGALLFLKKNPYLAEDLAILSTSFTSLFSDAK